MQTSNSTAATARTQARENKRASVQRSGDRQRDAIGDGLQLGQKTFAHVVARGARRVRGEIERGDDLLVAIDDRHGDRAQAALEFLVDQREALMMILAYALEQRLQIGRASCRERG